jgi:hypothetical protein
VSELEAVCQALGRRGPPGAQAVDVALELEVPRDRVDERATVESA